jgi:ABC-2 type transport system ATP-binding protein
VSAAGPPQGANNASPRGCAAAKPIEGNHPSASAGAERSSEIVIDVRGLNKHFGANHVVRDVSLTVRRGEIFGFLGPNGSGKTTTIRMLCGLLTPDSGEGTCLGYDIRRNAYEIKKRAGYMTQRFSFWEDLTIRENLRFVARMYGMPDRNARVEAALDRLGLTARGDQLAGTLSGGWKQRLALSACLLHEPLLLLLDEPTAGVDPEARREFWEELHAFAATGITVLVSTHYMDEAERCHKLAYILNGRLLAQGSVEEVVAGQALVGWSVAGPDLASLARDLRALPGVEQVAAFGGRLHVVGRDAQRLDADLAPFRADTRYRWERVQPGLEDVFIHLMRSADAAAAENPR